jgi:hypothetical protein
MQLAGLSNENRFDAAYKAIMQLSNAALQAAGFRTLTSKTGHHQTTFHKACFNLWLRQWV